MPSGPVQRPLVPCSTSVPSTAFEKALAGMALAARQVALDVQMGFLVTLRKRLISVFFPPGTCLLLSC